MGRAFTGLLRSVLECGLLARNSGGLEHRVRGILRFGSEFVGDDLGVESALVRVILNFSFRSVGHLNHVVSSNGVPIGSLTVAVRTFVVLCRVAELVRLRWAVIFL